MRRIIHAIITGIMASLHAFYVFLLMFHTGDNTYNVSFLVMIHTGDNIYYMTIYTGDNTLELGTTKNNVPRYITVFSQVPWYVSRCTRSYI